MKKNTITTNEILEANKNDIFTQREFSKDDNNKKYIFNIFHPDSGKRLARFFFDEQNTVGMYDESGNSFWRDWTSKYYNWVKIGLFKDL